MKKSDKDEAMLTLAHLQRIINNDDYQKMFSKKKYSEEEFEAILNDVSGDSL